MTTVRAFGRHVQLHVRERFVLQQTRFPRVPYCAYPASHKRFSSSSSSSSGGDGGSHDADPAKQHELFHDQMMDLREEREALFGFTDDEKSAWMQRGDSSVQGTLQETIAQYEAVREGNSTGGSDDASGTFGSASSSPSSVHFSTQQQQQQQQQQREPSSRSPPSSPQQLGRSSNSEFTHISQDGANVSMVDVGEKETTRRTALARTKVVFPPEVMAAFGEGVSRDEMIGPKGPIFATAKVAGIMAAKKTSDLIPLCHPLPLNRISVEIYVEANVAVVECECCVSHTTGVEMEVSNTHTQHGVVVKV